MNNFISNRDKFALNNFICSGLIGFSYVNTFKSNSLKFALNNFYLFTIDVIISHTGLSFDAALKITKVELELLTDGDMLNFFYSGIRGGISSISQRYSKANNPLVDGFDESEERKWLLLLDANNLYAHSLSQPLPTGGFRWLSFEDAQAFDLMGVSADGEKGYVLEVDLGYPDSIHDLHNDYPLAAEKLVIKEEMVSGLSKDIAQKFGQRHVECEKLVPNLMNKTKYVVHYRNLQFYVKQGLCITKIHRILEFNQSEWLKPYIELNTELRKKAKNKFEKDFFKLLNNSIYGKSIENLHKRKEIKVVNGTVKPYVLNRLIARPEFKRFEIINEDLVMIELQKTNITWNKPSYIGMVVLDNSKLLMAQFHYDVIVKRYGDKQRLLFTDTDSLCYEIKTHDVYQDMLQQIDEYDTSEYPRDHFLYSETNKKVLGKMKDEFNSEPIAEFVGLRSKMYSLKMQNASSKSTAKGIKLSFTKKHLRHQMYLDCLNDIERTSAKFSTIRSRNHVLKTESVCKIGLSPYDDKRYLLRSEQSKAPHSTLAYGHYLVDTARIVDDDDM